MSNFYRLSHGQNTAKIEGQSGSLVTLPSTGVKVIACSAPDSEQKVVSFWRDLVLQQGVKLVCCLVDEVGDYWSGCAQYWPTEDGYQTELSDASNRIRVRFVSKTALVSTLIQYKLQVQKLSKRRDEVLQEDNVTLLHFQGWPDLSVPHTMQQLQGFQELVRLLARSYVSNANQRALVHCRQGHGRTGTLLTILARLLQMFNGTEQLMTLSEVLVNLRNQRRYLCETQEQFKFAHGITTSETARVLVSRLTNEQQ